MQYKSTADRYIHCDLCIHSDTKRGWCDGWNTELVYPRICDKFLRKPTEEEKKEIEASRNKYMKYMRKTHQKLQNEDK